MKVTLAPVRMACVAVPLCVLVASVLAQSGTEPAAAFESASVKPAAADAPMNGTAFMIGLGHEVPPHGLLTMTSPLPPLIMFAYDVQDEVEARAMRARLPEWAQRDRFTIVARSPQDAPNIEQIRLMMRGLLEDRFALKAHRETRTGTVNTLVVAKPGVFGPGMKQHDPSRVCAQRTSNPTQGAAEANTPPPIYCGLELHPADGGIFHVSMIDVSLPEACTLLGGLGGVLGGRGMDTVTDATGLTGKWDITLDFLPERNGPAGDANQQANQPASDLSGPSFTAALEKQLGLRLKKGTGQIEDLIVDHIAQPTHD